MITVSNSSRVILLLTITLCMWYLKDFTLHSHRPPKLGELGGIHFQVMNSSSKKFANSSLEIFNNFLKLLNFVDASLKLVALLEVRACNLLLLTQNLLSVATNAAAELLLTISRWMPFVGMYMNMAKKTLNKPFFVIFVFYVEQAAKIYTVN